MCPTFKLKSFRCKGNCGDFINHRMEDRDEHILISPIMTFNLELNMTIMTSKCKFYIILHVKY